MASGVLPGDEDIMSENFTPRQAATILNDASRYEAALQTRTEGLTMMLWGIVVSAMYVTYGFVAVVEGPWYAFATVWIPWVLAGTVFTFALWRSAALSNPKAVDKATLPYVLKTLGLAVAFSIVFWLVRPGGPEMPLVITGAVFALVHALNLFRSSPLGRRLGLASGVSLLVLGVALALIRAPIEVSGFASMTAPGLVLGGLGLWQTLRG